jgi:hypothetical protein
MTTSRPIRPLAELVRKNKSEWKDEFCRKLRRTLKPQTATETDWAISVLSTCIHGVRSQHSRSVLVSSSGETAYRSDDRIRNSWASALATCWRIACKVPGLTSSGEVDLTYSLLNPAFVGGSTWSRLPRGPRQSCFDRCSTLLRLEVVLSVRFEGIGQLLSRHWHP